jgi:hypothetical protein
MLKLLHGVVTHPMHEVFIDRTPNLSFNVTHNKLGLGPLKPRNNVIREVASEASIVKHNTTRKEFVVVWQNLIFAGNASIIPVSRIVDETIKKYLTP